MKIDTLLGDPELRRDMGAIGRERVLRQFSWDYSAPILLRAYEKALEPRVRSLKRPSRHAGGAAPRPAARS